MCHAQRMLIGSPAAMRAEPALEPVDSDDTAHDCALEAFWSAIEKGDDALLPLDNRGRTSASVSELLIDRYLTDADLILQACRAAVNGQSDAAAFLLRRLVERVGTEYADDNAGAWA